jgi:hypothetical protein
MFTPEVETCFRENGKSEIRAELFKINFVTNLALVYLGVKPS